MKPDRNNREAQRPATEEQDRKALESNAAMDQNLVASAHEAADKDMEEDAEFTASSPNDDLDEGDTARLGEEETGLI